MARTPHWAVEPPRASTTRWFRPCEFSFVEHCRRNFPIHSRSAGQSEDVSCPLARRLHPIRVCQSAYSPRPAPPLSCRNRQRLRHHIAHRQEFLHDRRCCLDHRSRLGQFHDGCRFFLVEDIEKCIVTHLEIQKKEKNRKLSFTRRTNCTHIPRLSDHHLYKIKYEQLRKTTALPPWAPSFSQDEHQRVDELLLVLFLQE